MDADGIGIDRVEADILHDQQIGGEILSGARETSEHNTKSTKTSEAIATFDSECDLYSGGLDKSTIKLKGSKIPVPTSSVLCDTTANRSKQQSIIMEACQAWVLGSKWSNPRATFVIAN